MHVKTDPKCAKHREPRTAWGRWRFDRGRGKSCPECKTHDYCLMILDESWPPRYTCGTTHNR